MRTEFEMRLPPGTAGCVAARLLAALLAVVLLVGTGWPVRSRAGDVAEAAAAAAVVPGLPVYAYTFDAKRDPSADLGLALGAARQSGRRVLLMVGGDWCVWCFLLDRHFREDPEAARIFYERFEVLRVYYGDDNTNKAFLSRFPDFEMFPHFFVVESDGRVLASVTADVLIADAKYQTALIRKFAERWKK
jgi:thiol:disulfide interchange protein